MLPRMSSIKYRDPHFKNVVLLLKGGKDWSLYQHSVTSSAGASLDTNKFVFKEPSFYSTSDESFVIPEHENTFDLKSHNFTIEAQVRYSYQGNKGFAPSIVSKMGEPGKYSYSFWLLPGTIGFTYSLNGYDLLTISEKLMLEQERWYNLAVRRERESLQFYCDGELVGNSSFKLTGSIFSTKEDLRLFSEKDRPSDFTGWLDEVRITKGFARQITEAQKRTFPTHG